jgi:Ca2+-binding RTX toxin-like protein
LLSEQEILRNALLSPDMSQTTYYDVSSFVHYNELVNVGADEFEIFEGSTIQFDPLQNDMDPEGLPLQLEGWTQPANGVVSQAPTGELIYTPTEGFNGTDTFTYQVSDSPLRAETGTVTIHVRNADPQLSGLPMPDLDAPNGVANQPYAHSGTLFDPGVLDTHAVIIDWGDGTSSAANVTEAGGHGTFSAEHVYASGGRFRVGATITDNDGGTAISQTELLISGSGTQDGALRVIGSATADVLVMQRRGQRVDVSLSGHTPQTYSLEDFSAVEIILAAGDDLADLSGIRQEATVRGGSGNDLLWGGDGMNLLFGDSGSDWLYGGRASDALIGGTGNDWLEGRQGNDILIGGQDQDSLAGDQGDDLVIGAWTVWDTDPSALRAIRTEWSSARTFDQRIANLSGTGTGPRLNDHYFLQPNLTVYNDHAHDTMIGGPGRDWFFADLDAQNNDDDQLWWLDLRKDRVTGA